MSRKDKYPTKGPGDLPEPTDDPRSPAYDDSRDEFMELRVDELVDEFYRDEQRVNDSLSYFFTIGSGDELQDAINRFFNQFDASSNEKMAGAALELFKTLDAVVNRDAREEAEAQAEREYDEPNDFDPLD